MCQVVSSFVRITFTVYPQRPVCGIVFIGRSSDLSSGRKRLPDNLSDSMFAPRRTTHSSGTVREFHPIPFSSPKGEPITECKDSANRTKYQIYLDIFEMQPIFERSSKVRISEQITKFIWVFSSVSTFERSSKLRKIFRNNSILSKEKQKRSEKFV